MGWRYQAKRVKEDFGDGYEYTVVEAFPDLQTECDDVIPHTESTKFFGKTMQDLANWLRTAADDIEKYDVIICEDEDE
jgi:hypothetical protein